MSLIEDLAKAVNQVQTLKDLLKSGRGLLAAASASIPEYERYLCLSCFGGLQLTQQGLSNSFNLYLFVHSTGAWRSALRSQLRKIRLP